jgi:DNA-binding transcriptional regulator PaaX
MTIKKYKYYFKKPRSAIVKDILQCLAVGGLIIIAATSPYFVHQLMASQKKFQRYKRKKFSDTFSRLKREGLIKVEMRGHQVYISLTKKGKAKAGWMQIDSLKIKKPKKWNGKWWLVIFDIAQLKKQHREVFRGKLKELGFYPLQKSVWVYPFPCQAEIELLRDFFGLSKKEVQLVLAEKIERDKELKQHFGLK